MARRAFCVRLSHRLTDTPVIKLGLNISGPFGAAKKLGVPRQTLDSKIAVLGIDKSRFKAYINLTAVIKKTASLTWNVRNRRTERLSWRCALSALTHSTTLSVPGTSSYPRRRICPASVVSGFIFKLFTPQTVAAAGEALLGYLKDGALQPTIGKVFPLSEAAEAVRYLIEDRPYGRVLMQVPRP
jgi:NADPH:quinone reductase-like Zn-dependent oxidoreductase